MVSRSQIAVLLSVVVGLVFAITFVSQWVASSKPKDGPVKSKGGTASYRLFPPNTTVEKSLVCEMYPADGHYDFLFANAASVPVEAGLVEKNCACSSVEVLYLTAQDEKTYRDDAAATAAQLLTAPSGLPAFLAPVVVASQRPRAMLGQKVKGQRLEKGRDAVTVPAGGRGLLRLRWQAKEAETQLLKVTISSQPQGEPKLRTYSVLEVPVIFVPPVFVQPKMQTLPRPLLEGQEETITSVCWSATRPAFELKVKETGDDPCFATVITPLNAEECKQWLVKKHIDQELPVVSGYLISVTMSERSQGKQLDLGLVRRKIMLASDALLEPVSVEVMGTVFGEVRLVPPDLQGRIKLGDFAVDEGKNVTVLLEADRPETKLTFSSSSPNYLEAKVEEVEKSPEGKKQWRLTVTAPPNRIFGRLPPESEIVLHIQGKSLRGLRIPVSGHADMPSK